MKMTVDVVMSRTNYANTEQFEQLTQTRLF